MAQTNGQIPGGCLRYGEWHISQLAPRCICFLDNWKTLHCVQGKFAAGLEGLTMITANSKQKEGNHDAMFVLPGKEHVLCWDCNYYSHRRGNKVCPNYNPSKWGNTWGGKGKQVNVTAGEKSMPTGTNLTPTNSPGIVLVNTEVSSLSTHGQEAGKAQNKAAWTVLAGVAAKVELVFCTMTITQQQKRLVYNFIRLFFACIPLIYQHFHIALCIPSILISNYFNDFCIPAIYQFAFILFHIPQVVFLFTNTDSYHFIWRIPTVYRSLKFFNVFFLMQIVIFINTDLYNKCIPQIYPPCGHYSKMWVTYEFINICWFCINWFV